MSDAPAKRLRAARVILTLAWQADRRRSILAAVILVLEALFTALFAYWLKLLLDGVAAGSLVQATIAGALLAISIIAGVGLEYAGSRVQQALNERAHHAIEQRLISTVGQTPTLDIHETPRHLTQLELLDGESWEFGAVLPSLFRLAETVIRVVIVAVLLIAVHPLLLALPLFGLPMLLLSGKTNGLFNLGNELASEPQRRANDLWELATESAAAKEIRVFRLSEEILRRFHREFTDVRRIHLRLHLKGQSIALATRVVFLVGYFGAIVFVVTLAGRGQLSVGDVALTAVLAGQVLGLIGGSAEAIQWALRCLTSASRFVYLQDVSTLARARVSAAAVVPERLDDGIRLEGLSYTYPSGVDALVDLNLHLPAGATVAVVGDNGAGKTTLVKLLAGLYVPTSGRILVDSVDLATLDPDAWRLHVSAGFQDYARFEFLVRETVGIGDLDAIESETAVRSAVERAGAVDLFDTLPSGLATQLGPNWPAGIDLSGGQWQKLAIARAMMRRRPLLLLLDEPTATLDAETEHRLFESWTAAARDIRRATGAVTILVSHRFSTVRMADLIVVIDNGRIVEVGTHPDLLDADGLYAELFEIQAAAYR